MRLLTKAIENRFTQLGRQDKTNAIIVCKFFDPQGSWTWYATEYMPETKEFFGMVHGMEQELGYFGLDELQSFRGRMGLSIERDRSWDEQTLEELEAGTA